ncbi:MAG: hypothetical protein R3B91_15520 [Planctomycetaceae bacterium]
MLTELPDATTETRIRQAYLACVSRDQLKPKWKTVEFLQQQAEDLGTLQPFTRLGDLCQVLLNTKEFLFVQ